MLMAVVSARRTYLSFLLACLAGFLFCFLTLFFLSGSDWFSRHDDYPALRNVGYSVRAHHLNCQVLLWGDSAALTGLDPKIIRAETGLTACNAAEGLTTQLVVGSDLPLQAYLDQNEAPRLVVGLWSYTALRPEVPAHSRYTTEGMFYGLRYTSRWRFLWMLLRSGHPHWVTRYVFWAAAHLDLSSSPDQQKDAEAERKRGEGLYQFPRPPQTTCVRNAPLYGGADAIRSWPGSVADFRTRYTTARTAVLVDISPIPACSIYRDVYEKTNTGLHDNPLSTVPIRYFNDSDLHFSPEGSRFLSEQVAQQINAVLKR